jgi:hypothetical protein
MATSVTPDTGVTQKGYVHSGERSAENSLQYSRRQEPYRSQHKGPWPLTSYVGGHEKLPGDGHKAARWRT